MRVSRHRASRLGRPSAPRLAPIDPEFESWLLENLEREGHIVGRGYQAVVRRLETPRGAVVVKSPHSNPLLAWLGRRSIRREARVYDRLHGIDGIPESHGLARGDHLVLEHVEGDTLRAVAASLKNRERFFARLLETIRTMHAAGVAHGDLKRKENTLVTADESPRIIDFGIATVREAGALRRRQFDTMRQMDLNAWVKLKYGRNTASLPADEAALYRPLLVERWARKARKPWKVLTLRGLRKRRRAGRGQR